MELSSDPLADDLASSPPTTDSLELGELPNCPPSPRQPVRNPPESTRPFSFEWDLSTDPLGTMENLDQHSANTHRLQSRKRGPSLANALDRPPKGPRISTQQNTPASPNQAQGLILQARDLLVKAYSASNFRAEQAKLLDLLEVFRQYTENGIICKASSILATQVASLEQATRKIENQTRQTSS